MSSTDATRGLLEGPEPLPADAGAGATALDREEPYVGPRPFQTEDRAKFFGRDEEASELISLIIAHPVLLFYAQSGAGKTSLLNARVVPLLRERHSEVFGTARVAGEMPKGVLAEGVENVFVFNALMSLHPNAPDPGSLAATSLADFLKSQPHPEGPGGLPSPRVLIFDQFEEIFTSWLDRWRDRAGFFDAVGEALESDMRLRVVFAMREEYIANLDPYASVLPERMRTRFRMERLRERAALAAVKGPLAVTGRSFAPGAAEKLVGNLLRVPVRSAAGTVDIAGEFIEPVQLQVVCQRLWQSLPPDVREIDKGYIKNYGDVDQALSTYYEECLEKVESQADAREGVLRRWFEENLITADGTRGTVYKDEARGTTGGLANRIVDLLEALRLVRVEMRGGAPWYELTHDRFIAPITQSNRRWREARDQENLTDRALRERAEVYYDAAETDRDRHLLEGRELEEAVLWLKSPEAEEVGVDQPIRDFVGASQTVAARRRAEQQAAIARGLRRQRALLVFLILGAVAAAVFAYQQKRRADDATLEERGRLAESLSRQRGKGFDALVLAINAVGERVRSGAEPPADAVKGLRASVRAVGHGVWLRGRPGAQENVSLSADGTRAMTAGEGELCVWDTATGRPLSECIKPEGRINTATLSSDGRRVVLSIHVDKKGAEQGGAMRMLGLGGLRRSPPTSEWRVLDSQTWNRIDQLKPLDSEEFRMEISSNATQAIVTNYVTDNVRFLDVLTGQPIITLKGGQLGLSRFGFSPTGALLAGRDYSDVKVHLWNVKTGKQIKRLVIKGAGVAVTSFLAFSPDDQRVMFVSEGISEDRHASAVVWDAVADREVALAGFGVYDTRHISFTPDGTRIIVAGFDKESKTLLQIFNAETGESLLKHDTFQEDELILSCQGSAVVIGQFENPKNSNAVLVKARVWDVLADKTLLELDDLEGTSESVRLSEDASHVLVVRRGTPPQVWDLRQPPLNVEEIDSKELLNRACEQLRPHEKEFKAVANLCG